MSLSFLFACMHVLVSDSIPLIANVWVSVKMTEMFFAEGGVFTSQ